jgi:hypothetical protein
MQAVQDVSHRRHNLAPIASAPPHEHLVHDPSTQTTKRSGIDPRLRHPWQRSALARPRPGIEPGSTAAAGRPGGLNVTAMLIHW